MHFWVGALGRMSMENSKIEVHVCIFNKIKWYACVLNSKQRLSKLSYTIPMILEHISIYHVYVFD